MTDAPADLPARHTVLRSLVAHLDADPDAVFALLADRLATGDETGGHYLADKALRLVVVQGDWWYRGEYRVLPERDGSLVEHEIINVARFAHWAGAWAARSVVAAAPAAFQRLLADLSAELERGRD